MKSGDVIALYGAVVATAVAIWQWISYRSERRPNLSVNTHLMSLVAGVPPEGLDPKEWVYTLPWRLQIEVLNRGRSDVKVGRIEVRTNETASGYDSWSSLDWGLPWNLTSGDERIVDLTDEQGGPLKAGQVISVIVTSTTGKEFTANDVVVGQPGQHFAVVGGSSITQLVEGSRDQVYVARHSVFGSSDPDDALDRFLARLPEDESTSQNAALHEIAPKPNDE